MPVKALRFSILLCAGVLAVTAQPRSDTQVPKGFVNLLQHIPGIVIDLRYYGSNNFVGTRIDGYEKPVCYLSLPAADALKKVQAELARYGLGLKVFDAYRPQLAVNHFVRWARDLDDTLMRAAYYPDVAKQNLFSEGYIAKRSSHTRGSTVDVSLVDLSSGRELDMGTGFDYFGPESWPDYGGIGPQQRANRLLLRKCMLAQGFKPYKQEWWHFTLTNEPWPDTYFDFPVR